MTIVRRRDAGLEWGYLAEHYGSHPELIDQPEIWNELRALPERRD